MGCILQRCLPSRNKSVVLGAIGVVLMGGSAGCSNTWGKPPPCMPPEYTVTPSMASAGETVVVAALDAGCDPRYGDNARVAVSVTDAAGVEVLKDTAPMADAGSFTYRFEVPAGVAAGEALVSAYPHNVDWCDDTGVNNRAAAGVPTLGRVSCAERLVPFTVR